jgi:hypothetical protein
MIFLTILNDFKFVTFRMACKRSSVRLRYSPPDNQPLTILVGGFFIEGNTLLHVSHTLFNIIKGSNRENPTSERLINLVP